MFNVIWDDALRYVVWLSRVTGESVSVISEARCQGEIPPIVLFGF